MVALCEIAETDHRERAGPVEEHHITQSQRIYVQVAGKRCSVTAEVVGLRQSRIRLAEHPESCVCHCRNQQTEDGRDDKRPLMHAAQRQKNQAKNTVTQQNITGKKQNCVRESEQN